MASDANLIKGARDVAMGAANSIKAAGTGLDALGKASAQFVQQGVDEIKARTAAQKKRKLEADDKLAESIELSNTSAMNLSEQHYAEVQKSVKGLKKKHSACGLYDDDCRREAKMAMQAQTQRMNSQKELRDGNKEAYNNGLLSKSLTDDEKNIMAIYMNPNANEYTLSYDGNPLKGGEGQYEIANPNYDENLPEDDVTNPKTKTYKESDITKMFDKQIDVKGKESSSKYGVSMVNDGLNGVEYNAVTTKQKYNDMVTKENLHSFTNDDMGFGSFKQDILTPGGPIDKALMTVAQDPTNNFAITPGEGDGDGPWYTNIDASDREMMFDAITNKDAVGADGQPIYNEDLHKEMVVGYYETMSAKNHAKGAKQAADAAEKARLAKIQELKEKKMLKRYDANLEIAIDNNQSQLKIDELTNKMTLENAQETTDTVESTDESQAPLKIPVPAIDGTTTGDRIEVTREVALQVGEKIDGNKPVNGVYEEQMFRGTQGVYFQKSNGELEYFTGSDEDIREQIIEDNQGIEMYVKNREDIFEALKKYNSKRKKKNASIGGTAITLEKMRAAEGIDEAQNTEQSKTVTTKKTTSNKVLDNINKPKVKLGDFDFNNI
tara:strand:- start:1079 stop:2902 length:1824 start_codon:yes stop_codon:yes gene_type:complete